MLDEWTPSERLAVVVCVLTNSNVGITAHCGTEQAKYKRRDELTLPVHA